jgi:sialidase-1
MCEKQEVSGIHPLPKISFHLSQRPIFSDQSNGFLGTLDVDISGDDEVLLKKIDIHVEGTFNAMKQNKIMIVYKDTIQDFSVDTILGKPISLAKEMHFAVLKHLSPGRHSFKLYLLLAGELDLESSFQIDDVDIYFNRASIKGIKPTKNFTFRPCVKLRKQGQDGCDTYRIPGLITTNLGTLIAVYDNRYRNSKDLQEDIDVGMSRSTDGGKTWQPMRVILDMDTWGSLPQNLNGVGDPCILYDASSHTIWVAALWMHGGQPNQMAWWASKPGLQPNETGQIVMTKSSDDGITWSEPINITNQIKNPAWQLLFCAPGRGITLENGTLVFPAQFKSILNIKAIDGGQFTCHATILYSEDKGQTWHIGSGAKSNTTESQIVPLSDGSLMLNMRDDRNRTDKSDTNGRAVSVTFDLGQTWKSHPSSNKLLPEPNCMASLISTNFAWHGKPTQVLLFSNPDSKVARSDMTIKASLDEGISWPEKYHLKLNSDLGYGYSCLTMVDKNTVGIVYEGVKELYFQKIKLTEILK